MPQGSILGPLLFLVYINDMTDIISRTSMYQYADDTVLLATGSNVDDCKYNMQLDLSNIVIWCNSNKLSLNFKKTKCMLFGFRVKLKNLNCPRLRLNNTNIDFGHQYKYLGVILDPHLTFNKHLNNIIKITAHKINLLSKVRLYLTKDASLTIFKTMILPYFDYGDILFLNSSKKLLDKLDRLQIRALKLCLKSEDDMPENIMMRSTNTAPLNKRRYAHLLNHMYKNCIDLLDIKDVNTRARAAPVFKTIIPKCEKYKNSVLYIGAIKWNNLPVNLRNIETYDSFKNIQKRNMLL